MQLQLTDYSQRVYQSPETKRAMSERIAKDVEAFLAKGGKITVVPPGASSGDYKLTWKKEKE